MTLQLGTLNGAAIYEDSEAVGVAVRDVAGDGGDLTAINAAVLAERRSTHVVDLITDLPNVGAAYLIDGQTYRTLGQVSVGDGRSSHYVYHATGRSEATIEAPYSIDGPGADDYFEALWNRVPGQMEFVEVPETSLADYGAWVNLKIDAIQTNYPSRWGITFDHSIAEHDADTRIVLDKTVAGSHLTFTSPGQRQCRITKRGEPGRVDSVLFDLYNADECDINNLILTEQSGHRNCAMIRTGGTTNKIRNNWISAAGYGLLGGGAGLDISDNTLENCDVLIELCSRYWNPDLGIPRATHNLQHAKLTNNTTYTGAMRFVNYMQVQLNVTSGTISVGDTITANSVSDEILVVEDEGGGVVWILITNTVGQSMSNSSAFTTDGGATGTITSRANNRCQNILISQLQSPGDTAVGIQYRNVPSLYVNDVITFEGSNLNFFEAGWAHFINVKNLQLDGTCVMANDVAALHSDGTIVENCWGIWKGWVDAYPVDIDGSSNMIGDYFESMTGLRPPS